MASGGLLSGPALSVDECQLEPRPISPKWEGSRTTADSSAPGTLSFSLEAESLLSFQALLHPESMARRASVRRAKWERKQSTLTPDPKRSCLANDSQDVTALPTDPWAGLDIAERGLVPPCYCGP